MKKTVFLVYLSAWSGLALAQAPTVDKTTVAFTYQYNNAANSLTAKVNAKLTSTTTLIYVGFSSSPGGWLSVTPLSGTSPLALAVTANPTSLSPGTYDGSITVYTGSSCVSTANCATVNVTLTITNPASSLLLGSPPNAVVPLTSTTSATAFTLAMPYTSGGQLPVAEIDVGTTGDIIPFNVTTAVTKAGTGTVANWLRVSTTASPAATSTSGVASGSSIVPISVTLDQATLDTLDAINYTGTITIAPVKTGSSSSSSGTSYTVTVTLSVAPGQPILCTNPTVAASCANVQVPVFPQAVPAFQPSSTVTPVPPILTLYGDNFFNNGSWVFYQRTSTTDQSFHALPTTWVSRKILTATIPVADLTPTTVNSPVTPPEAWSIVVVNGAPNTSPSNGMSQSQTAPFLVTDPNQPYVQSVVNAASYLPAATQLPAGTVPPYTTGTSVVSPREIVSIFGQGLGPTSICSNTPVPLTDGNGNQIGMQYSKTLTCSNGAVIIGVWFQVGQNQQWPAPLIVATYNQINAIVPYEIAFNDDQSAVSDGTPLTIIVNVSLSGNLGTYSYTNAVKMSFDPGIFTFGGNGQGQAAVLNVDATTGAVTVNGAASAPKGSPIEIFMTGLGDLKMLNTTPAAPMADGQVATALTGPVALAEDSYRVLIGGQSAPIFYAGTAGTGVAGLVQINAIVPPGTASGAQSITVEIGPLVNDVVTARRSQTGVTINVK